MVTLAIEYIKELMSFGEVRGALLQGLVTALTPASQVVARKALVLQSTFCTYNLKILKSYKHLRLYILCVRT